MGVGTVVGAAVVPSVAFAAPAVTGTAASIASPASTTFLGRHVEERSTVDPGQGFEVSGRQVDADGYTRRDSFLTDHSFGGR